VRGPRKKRFVITSRGRRVRTFIRRGWGISARTDPLPNPSRAFRRNANGRKVAVGYSTKVGGPPVKSNEPKRYSNSFNNGCRCVCTHTYIYVVYTRNTDGSVVVFVDRRRRGGEWVHLYTAYITYTPRASRVRYFYFCYFFFRARVLFYVSTKLYSPVHSHYIYIYENGLLKGLSYYYFHRTNWCSNWNAPNMPDKPLWN